MRRSRIWIVGLGALGACLAVGAAFVIRSRLLPPDVILITVESTRADELGCYGGRPDVAPHLDALATESVVYERAYSATSWTLASHASLFTGLYPTAHQTIGPYDRLDDSYDTLAEMLARAGYDTEAVVSGPYLRHPFNLQQGFARYDETPTQNHGLEQFGRAAQDVTSDRTEASVLQALDAKRRGHPLFLFAYFWDPHYDYIPPAPWNETFVAPGDQPVSLADYMHDPAVSDASPPGVLHYARSQYEGEIRWTDEHLGRLFAELKRRGLWDHALVIVTADHGEAFFEHGYKAHKNDVFDESVHVPLLVKLPGGRVRGRDPRLASLVDVVPTVLQVTRVPHVGPLCGVSLLDPRPDPERAVFTELLTSWYATRPGEKEEDKTSLQWYGVRRGTWELVLIPSLARTALFDLSKSPSEADEVGAAHPDVVAALRALHEKWFADMRTVASGYKKSGATTLDPAALEQLRSLGYVK